MKRIEIPCSQYLNKQKLMDDPDFDCMTAFRIAIANRGINVGVRLTVDFLQKPGFIVVIEGTPSIITASMRRFFFRTEDKEFWMQQRLQKMKRPSMRFKDPETGQMKEVPL